MDHQSIIRSRRDSILKILMKKRRERRERRKAGTAVSPYNWKTPFSPFSFNLMGKIFCRSLIAVAHRPPSNRTKSKTSLSFPSTAQNWCHSMDRRVQGKFALRRGSRPVVIFFLLRIDREAMLHSWCLGLFPPLHLISFFFLLSVSNLLCLPRACSCWSKYGGKSRRRSLFATENIFTVSDGFIGRRVSFDSGRMLGSKSTQETCLFNARIDCSTRTGSASKST